MSLMFTLITYPLLPHTRACHLAYAVTSAYIRTPSCPCGTWYRNKRTHCTQLRTRAVLLLWHHALHRRRDTHTHTVVVCHQTTHAAGVYLTTVCNTYRDNASPREIAISFVVQFITSIITKFYSLNNKLNSLGYNTFLSI